MNFHKGDSVMHWTHGLGTVVQLEERTLAGEKILYYAIQIGDMNIWVPADELLETRLRLPTNAAEFKRLMGILSGAGEPLPADRFERRKVLLEWLKDGRTESLFRVIRSLSTHRHIQSLNVNDEALLKRTRKMLLGEWSFSMSIPPAQAEHELQHLLASHSYPMEEHSKKLDLEKQSA